jgi:hypothetical protein
LPGKVPAVRRRKAHPTSSSPRNKGKMAQSGHRSSSPGSMHLQKAASTFREEPGAMEGGSTCTGKMSTAVRSRRRRETAQGVAQGPALGQEHRIRTQNAPQDTMPGRAPVASWGGHLLVGWRQGGGCSVGSGVATRAGGQGSGKKRARDKGQTLALGLCSPMGSSVGNPMFPSGACPSELSLWYPEFS